MTATSPKTRPDAEITLEPEGLLPCPFCGEPPKLTGNTHGVLITCINSECWGPEVRQFEWQADARAAWNRRSTLPREGQGEVVVKPLDWRELTSAREDGPPEPTGDIEAETMIGEYSVCLDEDEDVADTPWCCWSPVECIGHFADLGEAKAAAQADFASRIRSALVFNETASDDTQAALPVTGETQALSPSPAVRDGEVEVAPVSGEVGELVAWLNERAKPDSGISYEGATYSIETGRSRSARCELWGEDADFVAEHFHGVGAAKLASALTAANADRDRLRERLAGMTTERDNLSTIVSTEIDDVAGAALDDLEADRDRLARELERTKTNGLVLLGASGEAREAAEDTIARLARELEEAREALGMLVTVLDEQANGPLAPILTAAGCFRSSDGTMVNWSMEEAIDRALAALASGEAP